MSDIFRVGEIRTEEQSTPLAEIVNGDGTPQIEYLDQLRDGSIEELSNISHAIETKFSLKCEISRKGRETAQGKCLRETTLKKYPWFKISHLRDYLRFRTHLDASSDFLTLLRFFSQLQDARIVSIVKLDIDKMSRPSPFGWRMVATDLRLSRTGLIIEHYMTFGDMIKINETWLHKVYEAWRSRSTETMTLQELNDLDRDARFSRHAYRELLVDGVIKEDTTKFLRGLREQNEAVLTRPLISILTS